MQAHLVRKRLSRLTSYSVAVANGPTGNACRLGRPRPAKRACRSPRRPGRQWDVGVAQAEEALLVMIEGWTGEYGEVDEKGMLWLWFGVQLKNSLTRGVAVKLCCYWAMIFKNLSKHAGINNAHFMWYTLICHAHSATQVHIHPKCFDRFRGKKTASVSVFSLASGGGNASTAADNCSHSTITAVMISSYFFSGSFQFWAGCLQDGTSQLPWLNETRLRSRVSGI